jgi:hypothetical protein
MRALLAMAVSLVVGCSGGGSSGKGQRPDSPGSAGAATVPASGNKAAPAAKAPAQTTTVRVYVSDKLAVELRPSGSIWLPAQGRELGTLDASMSFNGKARLGKDGRVVWGSVVMPQQVTAAGQIIAPGVPKLSIGADGRVTGQKANDRPIRVEGAATRMLERRVLFVLILMATPATEPDGKVVGGSGHDTNLVGETLAMAAGIQ